MAPSIAESACVWLWLTLSNPVNLEKYWRAHSTEWNALILTLLQQHTALGEMEEVMHFLHELKPFFWGLRLWKNCGKQSVESSGEGAVSPTDDPKRRIHSWLALCIMFLEHCISSKWRPFPSVRLAALDKNKPILQFHVVTPYTARSSPGEHQRSHSRDFCGAGMQLLLLAQLKHCSLNLVIYKCSLPSAEELGGPGELFIIINVPSSI